MAPTPEIVEPRPPSLAEGEGEKGGDEEEVGVPMGVDDWEGVG